MSGGLPERDAAGAGSAAKGGGLIALRAEHAWFEPLPADAPDTRRAVAPDALRRIREGAALPAKCNVRVLADGEAALRFADGTIVTLLGPCLVALDDGTQRPVGGKRIVVFKGQLSADVAPQPPNQPLQITTAEGTVRVLGTRLSVAAVPDVGTQVELTSGQIEMRPSGGKPLSLRAGSMAFVPVGGTDVRVRPIPDSGLEPQRRWQFHRLESLGVGPDGELEGFADGRVFRRRDDGPTEFLLREKWSNARRTSCWNQRGAWLVLRPRQQPTLALVNALTETRRVIPLAKECWDDRRGGLPGDWNVALSENAVTVAVYRKANPGSLWVWNEAAGTWRDLRPDYRITSVAVSADGGLIAACTARLGHTRGHGIVVIDASTGREHARLPVDRPYPCAAAFSANGRLLAVALTNFGFQVWELNRGRLSPSHPPRLSAEAESPDVPVLHLPASQNGRQIAVAGTSERVWVFSVETESDAATLARVSEPPFGAAGPVRELAFTRDGRRLVVRDKRHNVTVWRLGRPPAPEGGR